MLLAVLIVFGSPAYGEVLGTDTLDATLAELCLNRPDHLSKEEAAGLLHWLTHESLPVRAWAAELLLTRENPYQIATVWILAHDTSAILQEQALSYAESECNPRTHLCLPIARFLLESSSMSVADWGRAMVFQSEPVAALQGASDAFVLDVLSQLSGQLEGDRRTSQHTLLHSLSQHESLVVRETAQRVLNYLEP